jgi:hypothetical protein
MIMVALQMKNINYMHMTPWLSLARCHQPTTGWQLQVASALSQPLIWPGSRSVKRTLFCLLFRRKHPGKDKRGIIFSFFEERYMHRPSSIRCLPEKKLNAFERS